MTIDALVNTNAGAMVYSGLLVDFVCKGEELDRIYLFKVTKREFKKTVSTVKGPIVLNETSEPKKVKGNTFSIAYTNVINLNLRFIDFAEILS